MAIWNWQRCHLTPENIVFKAAFKPLWLSLVISSIPCKPRCWRLFKKSRQWTSASDKDTDTPNTWRWPDESIPIAISTAQSITDPPWRTFSYLASKMRYLKHPSGRLRHRSSSSSSNFVALLTCVLLTLKPHSSSVILATLRVDTPWIYISAKANFKARSERNPFSKLLG